MMHMRRVMLILPYLVPPVFHRLYQPVNEAWTVKRFGCGCPIVGHEREFHFNANHFNLMLWLGIAVVCAASWWLLFRAEFVNRRSTKYFAMQSAGVYVLLIICIRQLSHEFWL